MSKIAERDQAFAEAGASNRRALVTAFLSMPEDQRRDLAARIKAVGDEAKQYGITIRMFAE
ncbi:hypothetical protein D3C80_2241090 [compost metagenome]